MLRDWGIRYRIDFRRLGKSMVITLTVPLYPLCFRAQGFSFIYVSETQTNTGTSVKCYCFMV